MSHYIHKIPGRIRCKSVAIRGNEVRARRTAELLEALQGVRQVAVNTLTGSVVVQYDPALIPPEAILQTLASVGCYQPIADNPALPPPPPPAAPLASTAGTMFAKALLDALTRGVAQHVSRKVLEQTVLRLI